MTQTQTTPEKLSIPRSELLKDSQLKWYKTVAGSPDAGFETQGNVTLVLVVLLPYTLSSIMRLSFNHGILLVIRLYVP